MNAKRVVILWYGERTAAAAAARAPPSASPQHNKITISVSKTSSVPQGRAAIELDIECLLSKEHKKSDELVLFNNRQGLCTNRLGRRKFFVCYYRYRFQMQTLLGSMILKDQKIRTKLYMHHKVCFYQLF